MNFCLRGIVKGEHITKPDAGLQLCDGFEVESEANAAEQTVLAGFILV